MDSWTSRARARFGAVAEVSLRNNRAPLRSAESHVGRGCRLLLREHRARAHEVHRLLRAGGGGARRGPREPAAGDPRRRHVPARDGPLADGLNRTLDRARVHLRQGLLCADHSPVVQAAPPFRDRDPRTAAGGADDMGTLITVAAVLSPSGKAKRPEPRRIEPFRSSPYCSVQGATTVLLSRLTAD